MPEEVTGRKRNRHGSWQGDRSRTCGFHTYRIGALQRRL